MNEIRSYQLEHNDVLSHFLGVVDSDGLGLSSQIRRLLTEGSFFALAPAGTSNDALNKFRTGRLISIEESRNHAPNFDEKIAELVCSLCRDAEQDTVFVREPYLREGDRSSILEELSPVGAALYKIIPCVQCNLEELTSIIRKFQVPWSFLLLLSFASPSENNIETIIRNVKFIAVNAYDGESYIYWLR